MFAVECGCNDDVDTVGPEKHIGCLFISFPECPDIIIWAWRPVVLCMPQNRSVVAN